MYKIPTTKNLFEILSDSDDIIINTMASINRNNTSRTSSLNTTIRINLDLMHDITCSARDIANSSKTTDPNTAEEDSEARGEASFENEEEDFSHLSSEEQAILNQIS